MPTAADPPVFCAGRKNGARREIKERLASAPFAFRRFFSATEKIDTADRKENPADSKRRKKNAWHRPRSRFADSFPKKKNMV
jgi:hypothetical protein